MRVQKIHYLVRYYLDMMNVTGVGDRWVLRMAAVCTVAVVVGGGMTAGGWRFPLLSSTPRQVALATAAAGFFLWWYMSTRTRTYVVVTPTTGLGIPRGTADHPYYEVREYGGHRLKVRASGFAWSPDGRTLVFVDRWGNPVRMLRGSDVDHVDVA